MPVVAAAFVLVASAAGAAGAYDASTRSGSVPDSGQSADPSDRAAKHIGSEPRISTCYKERYVVSRTRVGLGNRSYAGGNRYYSETDPALRFFNAHWIYDWEWVESTRSWTGSWRYLEDSLDTKDGEILTGWIWHSTYTSSDRFTTRPVEYELAERRRCGRYLELHRHLHDRLFEVGCVILSAAAIVVTIGSTVPSLGTTAPYVPTVAILAGSVCLVDAINDFFDAAPSSVLYDHGKDHWIIETGSPSKRVFIPDGSLTIQVYGE